MVIMLFINKNEDYVERVDSNLPVSLIYNFSFIYMV